MSDHICTEDAPYNYERHGYDVVHPHAEFQRDSVCPRGGKRMAIYRCTICGTRFESEPPDILALQDALSPEPVEAPRQKLKARSVKYAWYSKGDGDGT